MPGEFSGRRKMKKFSQKPVIALPKGRLFKEGWNFLRKYGFVEKEPEKIEKSRNLIIKEKVLDIILTKPVDVPAYVDHGIADIGVVGKDVIVEAYLEGKNFYSLHPLPFAKCRMSVAAPLDFSIKDKTFLTVASKYPLTAREFFLRKGIPVEVVKLYGSVELAPLTGLADCIVDIVETGRTLKENDLEEKEVIFESWAYLIANKTSFSLHSEIISSLVEAASTEWDSYMSEENNGG